MTNKSNDNLRRLCSPRHIAVFGGESAAESVRQCRVLGFAGEIWPVHPKRETIEGLKCFRSVAELPSAPDASFIAVPREGTITIVRELAARGAGGVVCYASGFSEVGGVGVDLQHELVEAAGDMALLGPNCFGLLNALDGCALWPDQHGFERVERGVAIVTQSGNVGLNLTMQRRNLPMAYMIAVGNKAGSSMEDIVHALLQDERVSAIGLHIEGLDDVAAFSRVAIEALHKRVPLVALKSGSSTLGAEITMSHTSSLAGPDVLYDTLFTQFGVARVYDPVSLLETLKFLHVHGAIPGKRIITASCSGGEASLMADLAQPRGLEMPALPAPAFHRLHACLGDKVNVANPLDYHTYIWGDLDAQTECFSGLLDCKFDAHLLVLDYPRLDRCRIDDWQTTSDAFIAAHKRVGGTACVVASMPEGLPDTAAQQLLCEGIAPMQGLPECLDAIACAATIGAAQVRVANMLPLERGGANQPGTARMLDEAHSKSVLAKFGLPIPRGSVASADAVADFADSIGYPVVVKAVSDTLAHKTEAGGVKLNLKSRGDVNAAVESMRKLSDRFLVEQMASDVLAEIIVGVHRDPQFGLALTVGAGGVYVELLKDAATLLLPVTRRDVLTALQSLKTWPLVTGFRARPAGDVEALLDAVMSVATYAGANATTLQELDVNPLLVLPAGRGVVAVDALIRIADKA